MFDNWSFGRKVGLGSAITVFLTLITAAFAVFSIREVVHSKDVVLEVHQDSLIRALRLDALVENHVSAVRGYWLTRDEKYLQESSELEKRIQELLTSLRGRVTTGEEIVGAIESALAAYNEVAREQRAAVQDKLSQTEAESAIVRARPARRALTASVDALVAAQEKEVALNGERAKALVNTTIGLVVGLGLICSILAVLSAVMLTRVLSRQLNAAIHQMRSASAELQAAAGQQASGAREQATAMTEVSTTMNELQATSREIAERAKRVAHLSGETGTSARQGSASVTQSKGAIDGISKQVDQIVVHMLELGRKSQKIGAVLDLVSELSEQTNVLAINATIEATGAGEAGRRFLVVADEIRKLAERVGRSTKEVRVLIEDVRSAVNTTVMATETGAKTVESGSRQFDETGRAFGQIVELVAMVTEAAREIELSTKQQASAVEQVNVAVVSVTQATREGEASAGQTLQTAAQLATLTRDLARIMQVGATN